MAEATGLPCARCGCHSRWEGSAFISVHTSECLFGSSADDDWDDDWMGDLTASEIYARCQRALFENVKRHNAPLRRMNDWMRDVRDHASGDQTGPHRSRRRRGRGVQPEGGAAETVEVLGEMSPLKIELAPDAIAKRAVVVWDCFDGVERRSEIMHGERVEIPLNSRLLRLEPHPLDKTSNG